MTIQDFIITPFFLIFFLIGAYALKGRLTNRQTAAYFIPALLIKFAGAIALGLIFQFYYGGGDTFTYHTHGSKYIWQAFMDNPSLGLELLLKEAGDRDGPTFDYSVKIWMFRDKASMVIIKIAALFDLLTFNTYSATALFFAAFGFSGHWMLFKYVQSKFPKKTRELALAILFVPSVVLWGSGILKDSITLGALCWLTYAVFHMTIDNRFELKYLFISVVMALLIYSIKIYILLCFLAATSVYLYSAYMSKVKSRVVQLIAAPFLLSIFLGGGYLLLDQVSQEDSRYALDKIANTAMITAYDIRYGWGARHGDNSGYTLGELDGSIASLIRLAPQGTIVTLFRPWLWEVKNPLMLLSAIESLIFLFLTIKILFFKKGNFRIHPLVLFSLVFALLFATAVGVSTYNFGTLMRYKIPVMPFYTIFLILSKR